MYPKQAVEIYHAVYHTSRWSKARQREVHTRYEELLWSRRVVKVEEVPIAIHERLKRLHKKCGILLVKITKLKLDPVTRCFSFICPEEPTNLTAEW